MGSLSLEFSALDFVPVKQLYCCKEFYCFYSMWTFFLVIHYWPCHLLHLAKIRIIVFLYCIGCITCEIQLGSCKKFYSWHWGLFHWSALFHLGASLQTQTWNSETIIISGTSWLLSETQQTFLYTFCSVGWIWIKMFLWAFLKMSGWETQYIFMMSFIALGYPALHGNIKLFLYVLI